MRHFLPISLLLLLAVVGLREIAAQQFGLRNPAFLASLQSAAAAGTPDYTNDLALWLKASWETGYADNASVTSATDFSGQGHHWTNLSAVAPIYKTAIVNGKAVFRFNGTDQYLLANTNFFSVTGTDTNAEILIVLKIDNDPPAAEAQCGLWWMDLSGAAILYPYTDGHIYDGWGSQGRPDTGDPAPSLTSFRLYNAEARTTGWTNRLDTTVLSGNGTFSIGWNAHGDTYRLGRSSVNQYFDGDIAEVRVYSPPLTPANRATVQTALDSEYNLSY